jgi:hypothetical protein
MAACDIIDGNGNVTERIPAPRLDPPAAMLPPKGGEP